MKILFVLFVVMPVVEMTVLIKVGSLIGVWPTILFVLLTAVIGASLLKRQGLSTLMRANQKMNAGELPAKEVAEGFMLAVGGALLLTPGFVTDAIGFALLAPFVRSLMIGQLMKRMVVAGSQQFTQGYSSSRGPFTHTTTSYRTYEDQNGVIIEGEFQEESSRKSHHSDQIEKK
ncbi:FxsA family protein [Alkalimarinus sediminis]|uniref:FxsA family protein n=1 Tax=Alkalimarinus sediminis TaxID=1632866 RepID=A0A9E8HJ97_9ALTE|nr:FxsA family protein [Alkalimarinus sediminis]UZW75690.1 FxsA family protein [Alkalimarinus sediminis]